MHEASWLIKLHFNFVSFDVLCIMYDSWLDVNSYYTTSENFLVVAEKVAHHEHAKWFVTLDHFYCH